MKKITGIIMSEQTPFDYLDDLSKQKLSLMVIKNDQQLFTSSHSRLKPLFQAYKTLGDEMQDSIIVDKVIGLAAAKICAVAKVGKIITEMASENAIAFLNDTGIPITTRKTVPHIMNQDKTDYCPMEKMAVKFPDPEQFVLHLATIIKLDP